MTVVYYSCLNEIQDKNDLNSILNATKDASLSIILSEITKQELTQNYIKENNENLDKICTMKQLSNLDDVIQVLSSNSMILTHIKSENTVYSIPQYIAITGYDKDTDSFILRDPYLYTTKYNKAVKQNLVKYKTVSGSSNLISTKDAQIGFDIHLTKSTLESIKDTLEFYSISEPKSESPIYTMKVVTNTKVTIRKQPNETSSKVCNVYDNDIVSIYEIGTNNYARTDKGWLELDSLVLLEPVQKKVIEKTSIRKYPEKDAQKLGRYDKNSIISITKVLTDWCRTNKGWIKSSSLE